MFVEPELGEVINGERGILKGIEVCLDNQCLLSGVALIFCAIDTLSALTRSVDAKWTDRSVFKQWAEQFLLPGSRISCTADDLYAARCGVLHTQSPESRSVSEGEAKPLVYEWRSGPPAHASRSLPDGAIVIAVEGLHEALKEAIVRFLVAADSDPEIKRRVQHHLPSLLCYRPWPSLKATVAA
jgi:hypothetical protein